MADEIISRDVNRVTVLAGVDSSGDIKQIRADSTTGAMLVSFGDVDAIPNTDLTSSGPKTNSFATQSTITIMDLVYLTTASVWNKADADSTGTAAGMLAISLETKTSQNMSVALPGSFIRNDAWSWSLGAVLFISTTPGALTETAPSGTDDVVRVVGFAVTATTIYFGPSPDYITRV